MSIEVDRYVADRLASRFPAKESAETRLSRTSRKVSFRCQKLTGRSPCWDFRPGKIWPLNAICRTEMPLASGLTLRNYICGGWCELAVTDYGPGAFAESFEYLVNDMYAGRLRFA